MFKFLFNRAIYISVLANLILSSQTNATPVLAGVADTKFRQCIEKLMAKHQWQTAAQVESIKCHNQEITSAEGIQQFENIKSLSLYKNTIKTIDIKNLKNLETLNLAGNRLNRLILSQLPKLQKVYIFKNQLTKLNFNNLPQLTQLKANDNQLDSVNLASTPLLTKLYLFNNQLEYLEIKNLPELRYLDVRQNPMPDEFYDFLDDQSDLTARHDGNMEDWD
ncbi:leucine-rich repeat domain-containing protein [Aliikangiella coralliicola]|uniref:Leucine-rich repeat domain-containing protein n=1 Tax=Aliikangiella coralliicola TaxID=2592383 RepID=A0A545U006_9GAMM|nr:leucine-rich repeat domain-containing protein [Aliikangiella coralliicola]TQV82796.1 leucine-rich repeat domain-containing protein [Aliikangiella coralliicola]